MTAPNPRQFERACDQTAARIRQRLADLPALYDHAHGASHERVARGSTGKITHGIGSEATTAPIPSGSPLHLRGGVSMLDEPVCVLLTIRECSPSNLDVMKAIFARFPGADDVRLRVVLNGGVQPLSNVADVEAGPDLVKALKAAGFTARVLKET